MYMNICYAQMAVMAGFPRVYEIGPVFRAELSHTSRHLCEFVGLDFEMEIINHYAEAMDIVEAFVVRLLDILNGHAVAPSGVCIGHLSPQKRDLLAKQ